MAFPTPSIGDILMLSQLAWKIGCAFTAGRAGAPAQFQEVENELKSLTTSITLLAESLDEDGSLLARSDERTRVGLDKILSCCRQTLDDLDAFVCQYQEIRRPDEAGGLATQRVWRSMLVRNYKKIMWTTEGGDLQSLRNMLAMHTQSISLTLQALQSRSLSRLEKTIEPVADQIDEMHNKLNGELDVKIDEIHHVMLSLRANFDAGSPMLWPSTSRTESVNENLMYSGSPSRSPVMKPKRAPTYTTIPEPYTSIPEPRERQSSYASSKYYQTPQKTPELSDSEFSVQSPVSSARTSGQVLIDHRESTLIPLEFQYKIAEVPPEYERNRYASSKSGSAIHSPKTTTVRRYSELDNPSPEVLSSSMLPPPAIAPDTDMEYTRRGTYDYSLVSRGSESTVVLPTTTCTTQEQERFEQKLFTEAAVLCEVRGSLVDYTQPDDENPGEWKMVQACKNCKVCIVTKNQILSSGAHRFVTSIWALSDDRSTRLQQKLADGVEVIPYTVWGNTHKVVLRVPTELKFHDTTLDAKPTAIAKTSWINFNFENERDASSFQSALLGKTLLLSVQTKRTMRIHEGIAGTFAFAEQLCGLENLRLFQDPQSGAVLAMIHYIAQFHDGYLAFYLNSTRSPLRIRDEDEKTIRVKGLNVVVDDKGPVIRRETLPDIAAAVPKSPKLKADKLIKSVKIEFYTAAGKQQFKDTFKDIQSGPERFSS